MEYDVTVNKKSNEFKRFDSLVGKVLKVSHAEVKAKLDAEKVAKAEKRKTISSASGRVDNAKR